jgi:malonyl-CoA/methylmalonyl-CoA synthetase
MTDLEIVRRAGGWSEQTAVVCDGEAYSFDGLLHASAIRAATLARVESIGDLAGGRVVFLVEPGFDYVAWQWAIWRAGGIAVPLSASQAVAEWEFIVEDVEARIVIGADGQAAPMREIARRQGAQFVSSRSGGDHEGPLPEVGAERPALILYTSGTTSRPKGVVLTHANLAAQMATLVDAWGWRNTDRILHVLPLNHVHGIVVLGCALWSGACCEFLSPFDAIRSWERMARGGLTLFMAVPTIYARLASAFDSADALTQARWAAGARDLRLMVSGSAALPVTLLDRWRELTGHVLLERYGMTEIGMAISNPLDGPRRPGRVGTPLPGVKVQLVDEQGQEVAAGTPGEIEVRGPGVFREYWRRPDATRDAFRDGWFRTGDVAVLEDGVYRILGRTSVDIIKTGGYKVSALEIEEVLRDHPAIADVAVVGVPDQEWGERVAAAVVARAGEGEPSLANLRSWASSRLAKYKLPTRLASVTVLPRNTMGKVTKNAVKKLFETEDGKP